MTAVDILLTVDIELSDARTEQFCVKDSLINNQSQ